MSHFVTWPKALAVVTLFWVPLAALAEDGTNPCPSGTVTSGSSSVTVEGKQVARAGDTAGCAGTITEGSPDVFINGKPAAVQGVWPPWRIPCIGARMGESSAWRTKARRIVIGGTS